MSFQITTAFIKQFGANMRAVLQQKMSRLRGTVEEEGITGESAFFDYLGAAVARKRTSRHGDTRYSDTPHSRRKCSPAPYDWADLIDKADKVRTLSDPTNPYVQAGVMALNRSIDDVIIEAFDATAYAGVDGATAVPFDTTNNLVASAATGLTTSKLISAKTILMNNDVDPDETLYFACTFNQVNNLLRTTSATSTDYAAIKALVKGDISAWMGFEFKITNRMVATAGVRKCFAYAQQAMRLGVGEEIQTKVDVLPTKNYSTQVYGSMDLAASRMDEKAIVRVDCSE